uniref:JmjC domain-containing protein n=1 Tax=Noctiluca scintillans TaxID=2966 RepID=A0A7S1FF39_NOCSC|mmetsp:Transcript_59162/g.157456  ORF Transcript_59162/g.157456 Transcript_59162/m.157456 type:complete len:431 (+) Transcript_59162:90-1382(+)
MAAVVAVEAAVAATDALLSFSIKADADTDATSAVDKARVPFVSWANRMRTDLKEVTPGSHISFDLECALSSLQDQAWLNIHETAKEKSRGLWREVYALVCLMQCALASTVDIVKAIRCADLGLIVAGPEGRVGIGLQIAVLHLSSIAAETDFAETCATETSPSKRRRTECAPEVQVPVIRKPLLEVGNGTLSMEAFLVRHLALRVPVVVRGSCALWPAVERWKDVAFWRDTPVGRRFVPVEVDYWFNRDFDLMTLRDFVARCVETDSASVPPPGLSCGGYLAQHALLDQIPELGADVVTPDIALCGSEGHLMRAVFFGPKGTATPLHVDPYENAFCQVVGSKYVRLYPPAEAWRLYPSDENSPLRNHSKLEPGDLLLGEKTDAYLEFPEFEKADFAETVLRAGDLLYLPRGWWHYVKSLSTSISVAFHFN